MAENEEKLFKIKIQDQEFLIPYDKWYEVKFYIKGVKEDNYYSQEIRITQVPD